MPAKSVQTPALYAGLFLMSMVTSLNAIPYPTYSATSCDNSVLASSHTFSTSSAYLYGEVKNSKASARFTGNSTMTAGSKTVITYVKNPGTLIMNNSARNEALMTMPLVCETSVTLTSGNDNQTVCPGSVIDPIVYTAGVSGGTVSSSAVTGLPNGLTACGTGSTITICGTVSQTAALQTYTYTITVTSTCGGVTTTTGTITVTNTLAGLASISGGGVSCVTSTSQIVTFTASGGTGPYTFTYSVNGGANQTVQTVTGTSVGVQDDYDNAGSYVYTLIGATASNGCPLPIASVSTTTATVGPLPVTITSVPAALAVCNGGTVTLTVSGPGTYTNYSWTPGGSTPTASSTTYSSVAATTSYSVQVTDNYGCTVSATVTVTVNPLPAAPTAGLNTHCYDGTSKTVSATVSDPANHTIRWYSVSTGGTEIVPTPTNTVTGTFTYYAETVSTTTGCVSAARTTVTQTIKGLPTLSISSVTATCPGVPATLTAASVPSATFLWSTLSTASTINVTPTAPSSSYTVTSTLNGCSVSSTVTIAVYTAPTVTASSIPDPICFGGSSTLNFTATPPTGGSYLWYLGTVVTPTAVIVGSVVTPISVGTVTYTVEWTDLNGCKAVSSTSVSTNPLPSQIATSSVTNTIVFDDNSGVDTDGVICAGFTGTSNLIAPSGPGFTYVWSTTPPQTSVTATVTPTTQNNTYSVTVSTTAGCSETFTVTFTTDSPLPSGGMIATASTTTCQFNGNPVDITFTGTSTNTTAPPYTFTFNVNGGPNRSVTSQNGFNSVNVSDPPNVAGSQTYTLTNVTDQYGCTVSITTGNVVTFTVNVQPSVTTTVSDASGTPADNILCLGDAVTVSATPGLGLAPYTYSWSSTPGGASGVFSSVTHAPTATSTTYSVIVTDANSCSNSAVSAIIQTQTVSATVAVTETSGNPNDKTICPGGTAYITATGTGGLSTYSYLWSTTATSTTISVMPTQTTEYTVTITNAGCTAVSSTTITVGAPVVSVTPAGPISVCVNDSKELTATSGFASYTWTFGAGTINNTDHIATVTPTSVGMATVTLTVADASGCTAVTTTTLEVKALPVATVTGTTEVCSGDNAFLFAAASGGTGPYTYLWSNGATVTDISVFPNQSSTVSVTTTYTVTTTDSNGCKDDFVVTVITYPTPTGAITVLESGNDINNTDGAICLGSSATLTAPNGNFFLWNNGSLSQSIVVTPTVATTYTVTVTTDNPPLYCNNTFTRTITINPLPVATITASVVAICQNAGSYNVNFTGSAATAPYTFKYKINGGADQTVTTTSGSAVSVSQGTGTPGTYTYTLVSVRDALGCEQAASGTVTVTVNALPVVTASASPSTVCLGVSSTLTASGAVTYAWSTGAVGATTIVTPSSTMTYTVTGTDANNCQNTATVTVTVNSLPATPTVTNSNNEFCFDGTTKTATAGVTSGNTLLWYTAATGGTGSPTAPGGSAVTNTTYYVSAVNTATGCESARVPVLFVIKALPTVAATANPVAVCPGVTSTLTATGASTYAWSTSQSGNSITVNPLTTTTYTVTGTAANGCSASATVTVTVNPVPAPVINVSSPVCINEALTLSTGSFSTYLWTLTPGGTSTSSTVVVTPTTAGTISVSLTVTNGSGCVATTTTTVTVNPKPTGVIAFDDNSGIDTDGLICSGFMGTSDLIAPSGGTGATYAWAGGPNSQIKTVTPAAGTYTVTVTNEFGCSASFSASFSFPPGPSTATVTTVPVDACQFGVPRIVTFTASNGTAPYTFTYNVNLNGVPGPSQEVTSVNGNNSVNVSDPANSSGLRIYTLTDVTDVYGCTVALSPQPSVSFTVLVAPFPVITVSDTSGDNGDNIICAGGSVTLSAQPGFTNYAWSANGSAFGSNAATVVSVPAVSTTSYNVTVTAANGCTNSATAVVIQRLNLGASIAVTENSGNGPANDRRICPGAEVTLVASPSGAIVPPSVTYVWAPGGSTDDDITVNPLQTTTYSVTISNAGCTAVSSTTITVQPPTVSVTPANTTICLLKSVTLTATPGFASYNWGSFSTVTTSVAVVTPTVVGLNTVGVTATDSYGCTTSTTAIINVNPVPVASITGITQVCSGIATTLTASGGTAILNPTQPYVWSNGTQDADITVIASTATSTVTNTTYVVTVTDINGCTDTESVTVTSYPSAVGPVTVTETGGDNNTTDGSICAGSSATLTAPNGYTGGTYLWSTGATTRSITVTTGGTYTVTVTVDNVPFDCSSTFQRTIVVRPLPTATIAASVSEVCQFSSNYSVSLTGASATAPYTFVYTKNSGSPQTVTSTGSSPRVLSESTSVAGTFVYQLVSVRDNNGCQQAAAGSATVVVNPTPALPVFDPVANTFCFDGTPKSASVPAVMGQQVFWYSTPTGGTPSTTAPSTTVGTITAWATYNITSTGCQTFGGRTQVTLTVNPLPPFAPVAGSVEACYDGTAKTGTASVGTGQEVVWYETATSTVEVAAPSLTVTGTVTRYAAARFIDTQCLGTERTAVSVTILPAPVPSISGDLFICEGDATTLTASGGVSYVWSNGATTPSITVTPNSSTSYSVTATGANGCPWSTSATVAVNGFAITAYEPASRLDIECPGDVVSFRVNALVDLTATSTVEWEYNDDISFSNPGPDDEFGWRPMTGNYMGLTFVVTSNLGGMGTQYTQMDITNATPSYEDVEFRAVFYSAACESVLSSLPFNYDLYAPISASNPASILGDGGLGICKTQASATFSSTVTGGTGTLTYKWYVGNSASGPWTQLIGPGTSSSSLTVTTNGAASVSSTTWPNYGTSKYFYLSVTDGQNACVTNTAPAQLYVSPLKAAIVNAGPDQTICPGSTANLNGTITGPAPAFLTGTWSAASGTFGDPNSKVTTYTPSITSGFIDLTLASVDPPGPCPVVSDVVRININSTNSINITPLAASVCYPNSYVITGTKTGSAVQNLNFTSVPATGTFTILNVGANTFSVRFNPNASGDYTITVTANSNNTPGNGVCTHTDNMTLTVNDIDLVQLTPQNKNTTVCQSNPAPNGYTFRQERVTFPASSGANDIWEVSINGVDDWQNVLTALPGASVGGSNGYTDLILSGGLPLAWDGYYFRVKITAGACSLTEGDFVLNVEEAATVSVDASAAMCYDDVSIDLSGFSSFADGASSASWSVASGLGSIAGEVYTPSLNAKSAGSVSLVYTTNDPFGPCPAVSGTLVLDINSLDIIDESPDSKTICQGTVGSFDVEYESQPGASVVWRWRTQQLFDDFNNEDNESGWSTDFSGLTGISTMDDLGLTQLIHGASVPASYSGYQFQALITAGLCDQKSTIFNLNIDPNGSLSVATPSPICAIDQKVVLDATLGGQYTSATWVALSPNTGLVTITNTTNNGADTEFMPNYSALANVTDIVFQITTNDPPGVCPAAIETVTVKMPGRNTINAGLDRLIYTSTGCGSLLTGGMFNMSGPVTSAKWSRTSGATNGFSDPFDWDGAVFTPVSDDITNGSVILRLTSNNDPDGPGGCANYSDEMTLTIKKLEFTSSPVAPTVCAGTPVSLTYGYSDLPIAASGGSTVRWNIGTNNITLSGDATTANQSFGGVSYTVTRNATSTTISYNTLSSLASTIFSVVISGTGNNYLVTTCSTNSLSRTVTVTKNASSLTANTANTLICSSTTSNLFSSIASGNIGSLNYQWEVSSDNVTFTNISGFGVSGATSSSMSLTSSNAAWPGLGQTKWYRVKTTVANCSDVKISSSVSLSVGSIPAATASIAAAGPFACTETPLTNFQLNGSIGGGASSVTWSTTSPYVTFSNINALAPTISTSDDNLLDVIGSFTVSMLTNDPDGSGPCPAASASRTITITKPSISISPAGTVTICNGTTEFSGLTASTSPATYGAGNILWSLTTPTDGTLTGATTVNPTFVPSWAKYDAGGTVGYSVTQSIPSCPVTSASKSVTINNDVKAGADPGPVCVGTAAPIGVSAGIDPPVTSATWSLVSPVGGGTFNDVNDWNFTTYTPSVPGVHVLKLTSNQGSSPCSNVSDVVEVTAIGASFGTLSTNIGTAGSFNVTTGVVEWNCLPEGSSGRSITLSAPVVVSAGSWSYQWEINTGSGWSNVSGSGYSGMTTQNLSLTSIVLPSFNGFNYRLRVNGSGTGPCTGPFYSGEFEFRLNGRITSSITNTPVPANTTIEVCSDRTTQQFNANAFGTQIAAGGSSSVRWQYSSDNSNWTDVPSGTGIIGESTASLTLNRDDLSTADRNALWPVLGGGSKYFRLVAAFENGFTVCEYNGPSREFKITDNAELAEAGAPVVTWCAGSDVLITGVSVLAPATSGSWTTAGDGSFLDPNNYGANPAIPVRYIPGAYDIENGSVVLTLTSNNVAPCGTDTDEVEVIFHDIKNITNNPVNPNVTSCATSQVVLSTSWQIGVQTPEATVVWQYEVNPGNWQTFPVSIPHTVSTSYVTNPNPPGDFTYTTTLTINAIPAVLNGKKIRARLSTSACEKFGQTYNMTVNGPIENWVNPVSIVNACQVGTYNFTAGFTNAGAGTVVRRWQVSLTETGTYTDVLPASAGYNTNTLTVSNTAADVWPGAGGTRWYRLAVTINGCDGYLYTSAPARLTLSTDLPAIVEAGGPLDVLCQNTAIAMNGASISSGATSALWTASPSTSGAFNNPAAVQFAEFTPATGFTGLITLTLTTNDPPGVCPAATDTRTLDYRQPVVVTVTKDGLSSVNVCKDAGFNAPITGITASISGGASQVSWSASPANGSFNSTTNTTVTFTPSSSASNIVLTVTTTNSQGCPNTSGTFLVRFNEVISPVSPLPTATVTRTVCQGSNTELEFVFSPTLTDNSQIAQQWEVKIGSATWVPVTLGSTYSVTKTANSVKLLINGATASLNDNFYRVKVSNGDCDQITSGFFQLKVTNLSIVTQPISVAKCVTDTAPAVFFTSATSTDGPVTYQWEYFNGSIWQDVPSTVPGYNTVTLTISSTSPIWPDDEVTYTVRCKVSTVNCGLIYTNNALFSRTQAACGTADLSITLPRPQSAFVQAGTIREGYAQLRNIGNGSTSGNISFRVFVPSNFNLVIPASMSTSDQQPVQNNLWNISYDAVNEFYTVSSSNVIAVNGVVRIGFILEATGPAGTSGLMTGSILSGQEGGGSNSGNNSAVRTFRVN